VIGECAQRVAVSVGFGISGLDAEMALQRVDASGCVE
jgi:hypothetical protein